MSERSVAELSFRFWTKSLLFSSTSQTQLAPKPQLQAAFLSVSSCAPWCNQLCTHCCNQSPDCDHRRACNHITDYCSRNFTRCQIYCNRNRSRSERITIKRIQTSPNNLPFGGSGLHQIRVFWCAPMIDKRHSCLLVGLSVDSLAAQNSVKWSPTVTHSKTQDGARLDC